MPPPCRSAITGCFPGAPPRPLALSLYLQPHCASPEMAALEGWVGMGWLAHPSPQVPPWPFLSSAPQRADIQVLQILP